MHTHIYQHICVYVCVFVCAQLYIYIEYADTGEFYSAVMSHARPLNENLD